MAAFDESFAKAELTRYGLLAIVLPRRWVVERTHSWFGRNRRLAKDFEDLVEALAHPS